VAEKDPDYPQVFGGIAISKRLGDTQELNERAFFMLNSAPDWIREWNPLTKHTSGNAPEFNFERGGVILCLPSGEDIGRTFTITHLLFDEAAFHQHGYKTWTALIPALGDTGKASVVSTPNGKFNMFYDLWTEDNGFCKNRIHWSQHPERDQEWADKTRKSYIKDEDWQREQELSFEVSAGPRMYPGFRSDIHVKSFERENIKPIKGKQIVRSWDYGFVHPAVVWWQLSDGDQVRIFAEMMGTEVDLYTFANEVVQYGRAKFGPDAVYQDVDDPWAANQRHPTASSKSTQTQRQILNTLGIMPDSRVMPLKTMQDQVRSLLKLRGDGQPGLIIDENCACWAKPSVDKEARRETIIIDGFNGGYARKSVKTPQGEIYVDEALKDGWYEHLMNALEFSVAYIFDLMMHPQGEKKRADGPIIVRSTRGVEKV